MVEKVKKSLWRYFGAMFLERKNGVLAVSLGRLVFLGLLVHAEVIWAGGKDIPSGMLTVLCVLLAYVTGSKVIDKVKAKVTT